MIKFLDKIYLKDYTHRFSRILLIHINSFSLIFHKLFLPFVTHPQQLTKKNVEQYLLVAQQLQYHQTITLIFSKKSSL